MAAISFKVFTLVAVHATTLLVSVNNVPAQATHLCKSNCLKNEEFPRINEKTS